MSGPQGSNRTTTSAAGWTMAKRMQAAFRRSDPRREERAAEPGDEPDEDCAVIVVQVLLRAKPENVARLEQTLREVVAEARRGSGCLSYAWYRSSAVDGEILVHAEFDDDEAFAEYRNGPGGKRFVEQVPPLLEGRPSFKIPSAPVLEQGLDALNR